jgi:hypothetical protein
MNFTSTDKLNSRAPSRRRGVLLLCLWFAFGFSEMAVAGNALPSCTGWYAKLAQFAERFVPSRDPMATLNPYVLNWLKFNAEQMAKYSMALKVGDRLKVDGISCEVLAVLGKGVEAPKGVYLVQTKSGLRVVKIFRNEGAMDRNFEEMSHFNTAREEGRIDLKTAKTLRVDRAKAIALMEYEEGIDVQNIHLLYPQFGLSQQEATQIYSDWQKLQSSLEARGIKAPADFNFTYNFKTKSFTLIDPQ